MTPAVASAAPFAAYRELLAVRDELRVIAWRKYHLLRAVTALSDLTAAMQTDVGTDGKAEEAHEN